MVDEGNRSFCDRERECEKSLILITSHLFLSTSGRRLKELNYSWLIAVEPHALGKNFRRNTLHLHTLEGKDLI